MTKNGFASTIAATVLMTGMSACQAKPQSAAPAPPPATVIERPLPDVADSSTVITTVVRFARGKTSAVYKNTIASGDTHVYVVNVRKGQYLGAQTYADTDVPFTVRRKDGAELEVPAGSVKWGGDVPESGDYEIVIGRMKTTVAYSITVSAE